MRSAVLQLNGANVWNLCCWTCLCCVLKEMAFFNKETKGDQSMELHYDIFMYYSVHVFPLMTGQWTYNIFFAYIRLIIKTARNRLCYECFQKR
jgi:hypothetical protein